MRRVLFGIAVMALSTGCAAPAAPPAPPSASRSPAAAPGGAVDPNRIGRLRADLPPGYEVAPADGHIVPIALWGLPADSVTDPVLCRRIVDPSTGPSDARGLSGSGAGGIVYVSVVSAGAGPAVLDPAVRDACGHWRVTGAHSTADVHIIDAPAVPSADTVGLTASIRTVVESGTQTDAAAQAFIAYLGDAYVFVTLVTDPGAVSPPLPPQFAADLLVRAVAVLRG